MLQVIQSINIVFCFICFSDIFKDVIYNQGKSNERNDIFCQNSKLNETQGVASMFLNSLDEIRIKTT